MTETLHANTLVFHLPIPFCELQKILESMPSLMPGSLRTDPEESLTFH